MNVTCHECGACTSTAGIFREVHRSFRSTVVFYCPACQANRQRRATVFGLLVLLAASAVGCAGWATEHYGGRLLGPGYWPEVARTFFQVLINHALFFLFTVVLILPHELGHALCAWLLNWRVCKISLGFGRTVKQFQLAALHVEINLMPGGGLTWIAPKELAWPRLKYFLIVLAGPMVHLVLIAATLPGQSWDHVANIWSNGFAPMAALNFANFLMLIVSLWPHKMDVHAGQFSARIPSDGLALLTAPILTDAALRQMHAWRFAFEGYEQFGKCDYRAAAEWFKKGLEHYSDDINNRVGLGYAACFLDDRRGGREHWLAVFRLTDLPDETRLLMLNNIAWTDLMIGDAELLDEADRFSSQAIAGDPVRPPYQGTRGSVLIERDQVEQGLPLVRRAFDGNEDPRLKALNACYLALSEFKRGDQKECHAWLERARQLDPECQLLEKMAIRVRLSP